MRWTPLLRGDDARRAQRAVARLLTRVRGRGASLAWGDAGIALALAEQAAAHGDDRAAQAARLRIDRAIAAMARDAMTPWLFGGFAGIAWVAHHAFGEGSVEIDAALARVARRRPVGHELLSGLVGLGVYALARPRAGLGRVVAGLGASAVRDAGGIAWETAVDALPRDALPRGTRRHFNLGIAHGLPGVVGLLALAIAARASRSLEASCSALLDGAVRWLLAHRLPDGAASCFPGWIDPGVAALPSPQGWCYGDAAIARVLWLAANAADEPAWRRIALDVARRAAARPPPAGGAVDAGLCHGSAGLAHIFNRHWQATGERVFATAARRWFARAVARIDRVSGGGFLSGRAGVALALLHATSAREPAWDRVLLLS
ncbi:MAG TPA: lanthionine synthetase LanC family protein [Kofleriaceae bacterium]|nr:lanthionine synthetase LanC family protein [Kofleriaceae bacterium]